MATCARRRFKRIRSGAARKCYQRQWQITFDAITVAETGIPMTSSGAWVQLVAVTTEEYCEATLYCDFNVSTVTGVQLQVNSSSGDWQTVYQLNVTSNTELSIADNQLAVRYSKQIESNQTMKESEMENNVAETHIVGFYTQINLRTHTCIVYSGDNTDSTSA